MIGWFRRRPTRADLVAEIELWKSRCQRNEQRLHEAYARAKTAEKLLRQFRREVYDRLDEPARVDGCIKVRFHRRPEAADWAVAVANGCNEDPADYNTYQCKICPRSPVTTARYWHVGHDSKQAKAAATAARRAQEAAARRGGRQLDQRIDPTVLARLRREIGKQETTGD
jgi:hypothetical protein